MFSQITRMLSPRLRSLNLATAVANLATELTDATSIQEKTPGSFLPGVYSQTVLVRWDEPDQKLR
jgi:hypothetical protein